MQLSIVVPLLNEEESIPELYPWIVRVMGEAALSYELIFIDDGSSDTSWEKITEIALSDSNVRAIKFNRNYGKSQALHAGFDLATGEVIITMDADLQDNPEEIPVLYQKITNENFDLVSGWKKKRFDSLLTKNVPSKLFNWAARKTSGLKLHDFNCGLKAYRREVVKAIDLNGEMHRYIPVLAKNAGFSRITEQVVRHQARKYGKTKFGYERFFNGFLDLISIWFISKFGRRPMHLFGALGALMFFIGLLAAFWIGGYKLYLLSVNLPSILITDNPWFYISLTTMLMGTLLFLAGFLGELIVRSCENGIRYRINETANMNTTDEKKHSKVLY